MMNRYYQILVFCLLIVVSCGESNKKDSSQNSMNDNKKEGIESSQDFQAQFRSANMYEVNIRQFTPEGSLSAFEEHIPRLKDMGVDILWLMPIYPISNTKKKGSLGSYYAISDYAKVNPEFGTIQDFRNLVNTVHEHGMKIILDFVPNHTGWDHRWIKDHPEFYTQDENGNVIDPIDPSTGKSWGWTDVADLNFDNAEMRKTMINDMLYWIEQENIDGFRMDVAHGVPVDFWDEVSTALTKSKPDVFMLAEAEVPSLRNKGYFQTDYGWEFHHILNKIAKGEQGPAAVVDWYHENQSKYDNGWHIQFTSNHDENSWAGTTEERMGEAHDALAALAFTIEGMPLIYGGQEEPLTKQLEFFEKDDIGFGDFAKSDWFKNILNLKKKNAALWNGQYGGKPMFLTHNDQILSYKREKDGNIVYCVFNLSDSETTHRSDIDLENAVEYTSQHQSNLRKGQDINLAPWGFSIYTVNL